MRKIRLRFTRCLMLRGVSIISPQMFSDSACLSLPMENGTVDVLDIRKGERSAEIKGLSEPQGLYYPSQNVCRYVSVGFRSGM
jgi:hypothetical protein